MLHEIDYHNLEVYVEIDERLIPIFKRSFLHIIFFTSENYPKEFKPDITFGIGSLAGFLRQSFDSFKNQKINLKKDKFIFGCIGGFGEDKNLHKVAQAFAKEFGNNKNYELIKLLAIAFGGSHGTIANFLIGLILIKSITLKHGWWFRLLNHRIMVWIGTLSYSLYLWQQFFIHNSFNCYNSFPINLLLIVIFALTSYHFIEKPFLRLKSLI